MTQYVKDLKYAISRINFKELGNFTNLILASNCLYIIGNGGSQSIAEHAVVDFIKFASKRAYSLSNISLLTMSGNDYGYEHSFSWVLDKYVCEHDLIIGISTSGKSQNILRSLICKPKAKTVLISGVGGKEFSSNVDFWLPVYSESVQILEDVIGIILHIVAMEISKRIKNGK